MKMNNDSPVQDNAESGELNPSVTGEDSLKESVSRIEASISSIEKSISNHQFKDEAISRMSKQIEGFQQDILDKIRESLVKELITIYDGVERIQKIFEREEEYILHEIEMLKEEVEAALYRNDVEKVEYDKEDNKYDKNTQRVVKREITHLESEDQTIFKVVREGFKTPHAIIRKQEVIIKTLEN